MILKRYLHQIVLCSDHFGRAYRREIMVTDRHAMVTSVEALPPHYETVMERMRDQNEEVVELQGVVDYFSGYKGCPFCGARGVVICSCGYFSCRHIDSDEMHACPKCLFIGELSDAESNPMSPSGLVHGRGPLNKDFRVRGVPDRKKEIARGDLRKYLEEQAKKRLEDKREK